MKEVLSLSNLPLLLTVCDFLKNNNFRDVPFGDISHKDMLLLKRGNEAFPEPFHFIFDEKNMLVRIPDGTKSLMRSIEKYTSEIESVLPLIQEIDLKDIL